jgi:hypothetical protein
VVLPIVIIVASVVRCSARFVDTELVFDDRVQLLGPSDDGMRYSFVILLELFKIAGAG